VGKGNAAASVAAFVFLFYCGLAGVVVVPVAGFGAPFEFVVDAAGLAGRFFFVVVAGAGHFGAGGGAEAARNDASCF